MDSITSAQHFIPVQNVGNSIVDKQAQGASHEKVSTKIYENDAPRIRIN